ncbi:PREDICTED: protein PET100 homolog, mitochondrial-like [Nicrophorus vespilloides]|uniref:Protein PET100 homolog, mitochondrial-like n=1 Tax=Nicrophorus vespilloides TaxID=110193 RepID=A0ABM1M737_NICVS|nr:PREDICTED: protein PET100 homolog, mitochondrial-like [Nicrophorus vespilloides]
MGNWQLEVGKMVLYMAFPVCLFHYFNQPQYFEKWVVQKKRELYPPDSKTEQYRAALKELSDRQRMKQFDT